jgi:hypothetical protein
MHMIDRLNHLNTNFVIYELEHESFRKYGQVHQSKSFDQLFKYLTENTLIPKEGNLYIANDDQLSKIMCDHHLINDIFGGMPLQFGYVNGHNTKLNALEYHKSSEVIVCASPVVLLLAHYDQMVDDYIDESSIQAFFCSAGTVIELFAMTLHFSPCKVEDEGFKCGIILPLGTNTEFMQAQSQTKDAKYLFKTNKWLYVHPDHHALIKQGAKIGIKGKNIEIKYR